MLNSSHSMKLTSLTRRRSPRLWTKSFPNGESPTYSSTMRVSTPNQVLLQRFPAHLKISLRKCSGKWVDVNLTGTFLMIQAVGARMAEAGRGSIINIGSIYGMLSPVQDIYAYKEERTGIPFIKPVAYSAAKSGLYNLTRYCATYWAKKGVRVNILTPSGVERDTQDETFKKNYCARMPVGRMAQENEYNGAIVFLASDASRYMTGANLVMDGGWTAW